MIVKVQNNRQIIEASPNKKLFSISRNELLGSVLRTKLSYNLNDLIEVESEKTVVYTPPNLSKINLIDDASLNEVKQNLIQYSKNLLSSVLTETFLCFNGKKYSVTLEKQQQLNSLISAAQNAAEMGIEFQCLWNAKDEFREEWSLDDLKILSIEIQKFIQPYVKQQQWIEYQILSATSTAEAYAVNIQYHF